MSLLAFVIILTTVCPPFLGGRGSHTLGAGIPARRLVYRNETHAPEGRQRCSCGTVCTTQPPIRRRLRREAISRGGNQYTRATQLRTPCIPCHPGWGPASINLNIQSLHYGLLGRMYQNPSVATEFALPAYSMVNLAARLTSSKSPRIPSSHGSPILVVMLDVAV